jgi:hypothetical protein
MQNKLFILPMMLLFLGGCGSTGDQLSKLVHGFVPQRNGLNEAKQIIQALAATEGISELQVGALYTHTPDRVRYIRNTPFPTKRVTAISLKDPHSKAKLERLRAIARKLSCLAVTVEKSGQVRVIMSTGWNADYGYEFFDRSEGQAPKQGDFLKIPGDENWIAFRG